MVDIGHLDHQRAAPRIDHTDRLGYLLHVSLSFARRDPTWIDIKAVRRLFFPSNVDVMMMLPAEAQYVNVDEHTFHLHQTPTAWKLQ